MPHTPDDHDDTSAVSEKQSKTRHEQTLRKRRLGMSLISYQVTFAIVLGCWYQDLLPLSIAIHYFIFQWVANGAFFALIVTDINLRFRDPSMTAIQMVISLLPALWVFYFLEAGQARTIFMLIAIVPALYGILALNTRQFLYVCGWFLALYGITMLALWINRPHVLNPSIEVIQALAFTLVLGEIAMIGGFISGLRSKLRHRNTELSDAMSRIRELVNVDELTGVCNRRRLFEVLHDEHNRYSRADGPFSVCILDIDLFKQVNDTFGHQAGDEILREVAQCIKGSLRKIDCFGRYGGEEFLMILPQTPLEGAMIKSERVRQAIEELAFDNISRELKVTVSIGVAEYMAGEAVDDTIARADQALYYAKDQGRNRTVSSDGVTSSAERLKHSEI